MLFQLAKSYSPSRQNITAYYRIDEKTVVDELQQTLVFSAEQENRICQKGVQLIKKVRQIKKKDYSVDALMQEFSLGDDEGIALMCLAEALLRIPDNQTRDELIHDKLKEGDWNAHIGKSSSFFINAASYGLLLGKNLSRAFDPDSLSNALTKSFARFSAPVMRLAMVKAMKVLGEQFVTGTTIGDALHRVKKRIEKGYSFSFDMLGEAALTEEDANRYFQEYLEAIKTVGEDAKGQDLYRANSISVKLSAIHPRYSFAQYDRVINELYPKLKQMYLLAKRYNISVNIDAEEASRLELSLDLVERLLDEPELKGYKGIGYVVQAYSKRCPKVIEYLIELAREKKAYLMVRLVKGAYWDSEIKWAQTEGLDEFPLYTRKNHTDIAYLACAKILLAAQDVIYPQFATHNVQTLCTIDELGQDKHYEFQCLHGMGEVLYDNIVGEAHCNRQVRVYAPVGTHETLLAYLVRRLLENGANSSFVHQLVDETIPAEQLMTPPWQRYLSSQGARNQGVKLASELFSDRQNSKGFDLNNQFVLAELEGAFNQAQISDASSLLAVDNVDLAPNPVLNPTDLSVLANVAFCAPAHAETVFMAAKNSPWGTQTAAERAEILRKTADLYEQHYGLLMKLAVLEAGKTLPNAIAELREAVDFLRYYAVQAENLDQQGKLAPPRGTALCISPWNFPLAIFTGQIAAALAAGNAVVAKPAEQTSLIAYAAVKLFYQAGLPRSALQLTLGAGDLGSALVAQAFDAVIFTGSTEVAKFIAEQLAGNEHQPILIAETGGQNVLVVDSSALSEQVVGDVLSSAFDSAGQRCSALRILLLQEDVADKLYDMLAQAMQQLHLGDPAKLSTDIGPVIDAEAKQILETHKANMRQVAERYTELSAPSNGHFVAPAIYQLKNLNQLQREVFGPILHILRYKKADLPHILSDINQKGYALTGGCHSRIRSQIDLVEKNLNCGNFYVNRNIVGAVVGVQPFGGHGLSGTGPKAGGEFYLQRLTRTTEYHSRFGDALTLATATPQLDSITGEENTLAYLPCEVAILNGEFDTASKAAEILLKSGFTVVVHTTHSLAKSGLKGVRVADDFAECQKGVYLTHLSAEQRVALIRANRGVFNCYDWQQTQDITILFNEFSRSENTTAAGGNASLMAAQEQ